MNYCKFSASQPEDNVHRIYHDFHYGTPIDDDNELFGRLVLEINQAGLSWETILKKQENFYEAYDRFDIGTVAAYDEAKIASLLENAGIIRNRLKVRAAVTNAQRILQLKQEYGSFKQWLDQNSLKSLDEWTKLFKKTFTFVGGEIVNEFLMSTGYLPGAHQEDCFRYEELERVKR
jgi:DNA-3-methyladenine glycosylase I